MDMSTMKNTSLYCDSIRLRFCIFLYVYTCKYLRALKPGDAFHTVQKALSTKSIANERLPNARLSIQAGFVLLSYSLERNSL